MTNFKVLGLPFSLTESRNLSLCVSLRQNIHVQTSPEGSLGWVNIAVQYIKASWPKSHDINSSIPNSWVLLFEIQTSLSHRQRI